MRPIDADDLVEKIYEIDRKYGVGAFGDGLEMAKELVLNSPTIEPDRPHGEWEFCGDNLFKCTHCGYIANGEYLRNWKAHTYDAEFPTSCLKCGADMRKEGDENG